MGSDSFAQGSFTTSEEPHVVYANAGGGEHDRPAADGTSSQSNATDLVRAFSTKVSREPLLPIGQKPKPVPLSQPPRPTHGANGNGNGIGNAGSATRLPEIGGHGRWGEMNGSKGEDVGAGAGVGAGLGMGGAARMRTSLERFLKRTLSNDTQMAEDTSYARGTTAHDLGPSMEDLELRARPRESEDLEFKTNGVLMDEEEEESQMGHERYVQPSAYSTLASRRQRNSELRPRYPDFDAVPPETSPPASHTPLLAENSRPLRKYQVHPSRNMFFLKGKALTGGDSAWPFLLSLFLVLGLTGTWNGTTSVWWWQNESPAVSIIGAYLCLLTMGW